jgi:hypothetical protein
MFALACSRLSEAKLLFPPYDTSQLQSILKARLAGCTCEGLVDPQAVNLACGMVARQTGKWQSRDVQLLRGSEAGFSRLCVCLHRGGVSAMHHCVGLGLYMLRLGVQYLKGGFAEWWGTSHACFQVLW